MILNKKWLLITYGFIIPVMTFTGWFFPAILPFYFFVAFVIAIILSFHKE